MTSTIDEVLLLCALVLNRDKIKHGHCIERIHLSGRILAEVIVED